MNKIVERLDKVQNKGSNKWMACCPAHDDKSPSLSISELSDGRFLMKCFAGCETADVLSAIGLTMSDLFPDGCLGEFKGFQRLEDEYKTRQAGRIATSLAKDYSILDICKNIRADGGRISEPERKQEQQAYMRIKNANNNRR